MVTEVMDSRPTAVWNKLSANAKTATVAGSFKSRIKSKLLSFLRMVQCHHSASDSLTYVMIVVVTENGRGSALKHVVHPTTPASFRKKGIMRGCSS